MITTLIISEQKLGTRYAFWEVLKHKKSMTRRKERMNEAAKIYIPNTIQIQVSAHKTNHDK